VAFFFKSRIPTKLDACATLCLRATKSRPFQIVRSMFYMRMEFFVHLICYLIAMKEFAGNRAKVGDDLHVFSDFLKGDSEVAEPNIVTQTYSCCKPRLSVF